jgi:transketolase
MTYGEMIGDSLEAAVSLAKNKIEARVINMSSLKPIDEDAVVKAAEETRGIVTVDNHNIHGGLGSAVAEVASQKRPAKMRMVGVQDVFGRSGTDSQMKAKFGLQAENIIDAAMSLLEN